MIEMHPTTFTLVVIGVAFACYYVGWKRGHISGHQCERQLRDEDNDR